MLNPKHLGVGCLVFMSGLAGMLAGLWMFHTARQPVVLAIVVGLVVMLLVFFVIEHIIYKMGL
jgi:Na+-driven multidrug efflux pump